jgi:hypothetical protein
MKATAPIRHSGLLTGIAVVLSASTAPRSGLSHRQPSRERDMQLLQQLDTFLRHVQGHEGAAGEILAGPRQALGDAKFDGVAADSEQDRSMGGCSHRQNSGAARHDQIGRNFHKVPEDAAKADSRRTSRTRTFSG